MSIEQSTEGDGSEIFWPGYVDAVTNLVLNLLFLLTIMTVAVFMFAMELGKQHSSVSAPRGASNIEALPSAEQDEEAEKKKTGEEDESLRAKNEALEKELKKLREQLANLPPDVRKQSLVPATQTVKAPEKSLANLAAPEGGGLIVQFAKDAVALTPAEGNRLRGELKSVIGEKGVLVEALVPPGFSEARRLAFYRALAVRNLLIELKVPAQKIEIMVRDGKANSDAALVRVAPR